MEKPIEEFGKDSRNKSGFTTICKECRNNRRREIYANPFAVAINDIPDGMRRCSKCGSVRSVEDFYTRKNRPCGFQSQCKYCMSQAKQQHRAAHLEEYKSKRKERYEKNKERERETTISWQNRNKECYEQYRIQYRRENREELNKKRKTYYYCEKNPSCNLPGKLGAAFVLFNCEVCGKEFRRRKRFVDYNYENRGYLPRFCSLKCLHESRRKTYESPYEKKIKEIMKRT